MIRLKRVSTRSGALAHAAAACADRRSVKPEDNLGERSQRPECRAELRISTADETHGHVSSTKAFKSAEEPDRAESGPAEEDDSQGQEASGQSAGQKSDYRPRDQDVPTAQRLGPNSRGPGTSNDSNLGLGPESDQRQDGPARAAPIGTRAERTGKLHHPSLTPKTD
jgi:hypothetical protein